MLDFIGNTVDLNTKTGYLHAWNTSIPFSSSKIINPYTQLNKKHDGYYPLLSNDVEENTNTTSKILAYPNPYKNRVEIKSIQKIAEISITNIQGEQVYWQKVGNTNSIIIPIENLPNGIFIATINQENGAVEHLNLIHSTK